MTIRIVPFLVFLSPPLIVSCIAHHCDKTTFNYVKDHSLRGNSIEMTSNQTEAKHNPQEQELTDHQKELLKIPLNAIRMSMSFLPFGVTIILKFLMMDFPDLFRVQIFVMLCCVLQGSRIVIILTCILKAHPRGGSKNLPTAVGGQIFFPPALPPGGDFTKPKWEKVLTPGVNLPNFFFTLGVSRWGCLPFSPWVSTSKSFLPWGAPPHTPTPCPSMSVIVKKCVFAQGSLFLLVG